MAKSAVTLLGTTVGTVPPDSKTQSRYSGVVCRLDGGGNTRIASTTIQEDSPRCADFDFCHRAEAGARACCALLLDIRRRKTSANANKC